MAPRRLIINIVRLPESSHSGLHTLLRETYILAVPSFEDCFKIRELE